MKRKQDDSPIAETKKAKPGIELADKVSALKQNLKEEQNELTALKEFVKEAVGENGKEFVEIYLKTSPECKDIFSLFDVDGRVQAEKLSLIWETFESILSILTQYDQESTFNSIGSFVVSKILQNHMKLLYSSLSGGASNQLCKSALKCMSLMLAQGLHCVKEFLSSFDFSLKSLKVVSKKRDRKQKPDPRTCFVRFCLAFFVFGDTSVIKIILEEKDLAALILNDLHLDSPETISVTLQTLYKHIVKEHNLLKKTKLLFFNAAILSKLTKLFRNPDKDIKNVTLNILTTLCTDAKYGICFIPSKEADRLLNPVLLKFLLSIKQEAMTQDVLFQLTVNTIKTCMDVMLPYINGLNLQMEPRKSDSWYQSITFVIKLLEILPSNVNMKKEEGIIFTSIPSVMSRLQFMSGLKSKTKKVQLLTLELLQVVLSRCLVFKSNQEQTDENFTKKLVHVLPDVSAVIAIRQVLGVKTTDPSAAGEIPNESTETQDEINHKVILKSTMTCLLLYQKLCPGVLTASGFNICKLLLFTDDNDDHDENVVSQSLQILLCETIGIRAWLEKKISGSENVLQSLLLIMIRWIKNKEILNKAKLLFFKILNVSDQFLDFIFEIDEWLDSLLAAYKNNKIQDVNALCKMFSECCMKSLNEPFVYIQDIFSSLQSYNNSETDTDHQTDFDSQTDSDSQTKNIRIPFSPLLVVVVKSLSLKDTIEHVVTPVLKKVLITQQYPGPFIDLLSKQIKADIQVHYVGFFSFARKWCQVMNHTDKFLESFANSKKEHKDRDSFTENLIIQLLYITNAADVKEWESCLKNILNVVDHFLNYTTISSTWILRNILFIVHNSSILKNLKCSNDLQGTVSDILLKILNSYDSEQVIQIMFTLPWLNHYENSNWRSFILRLYTLFLDASPSFRNSTNFQNYITSYLNGILSFKTDLRNEDLTFLQFLLNRLSDESLIRVLQQMFEIIFQSNLHEKEQESLEHLNGILTETIKKGSRINLTIDSATLQNFLSKSLKNKSCLSIFLTYSQISLTAVIVDVSRKEFYNLIQEEREGFAEFAEYLCLKDSKLFTVFIEIFLKGNISSRQLCVRLLSLVSTVLRFAEEEKEYEPFRQCLITNYWDDLVNCVFVQASSPKAIKLIKLLLPFTKDECKIQTLKSFNQFILNTNLSSGILGEIFSVIHSILKLLTDEELKSMHILKIIGSCMSVITKTVEVQDVYLENIQQLMSNVYGTVKSSHFKDVCNIWNNFVKYLLKHHLYCETSMLVLSECVKILYTKKKFLKMVSLKVEDIHQMIISHSKFTKLFTEVNATTKRLSVLKLVSSITDLQPTVCSESLVPLLLMIYQATQSEHDQLILRILQTYENNQLAQYHPLTWGGEAYNIYKERQTSHSSLLKEHSSSQILSVVDSKLMIKTALQFPIYLTLHVKKSDQNLQNADLYDPTFFLPFFASILQPGFQFDSRHFIDSGCLALVLAALSCYNLTVRKLAYYIMHSFNEQLEGEKFREKSQVTYFMMLLKNSVTEEFMRIPPVWCVFLIRYLQVLFHSDQHIYPILSNYILLKPVINVKELPVFLPLFNSSNMEYSVERTWVLNLLLDGMKDQTDFYLYKKYHVFELLMAFHDSKLSDKQTKLIILDLFVKTCHSNCAAYDLVKTHSILSWMHDNFIRCTNSEKSIFLNLLNVLLKTLDNVEKTPIPRLFGHEAMLICRAGLHEKSLSKHDQKSVCSIFIRLLVMDTYFGEMLTWVHDNDILSVSELCCRLFLGGEMSLVDELDKLVKFVTYNHNVLKKFHQSNVWNEVKAKAEDMKLEKLLLVMEECEKKMMFLVKKMKISKC